MSTSLPPAVAPVQQHQSADTAVSSRDEWMPMQSFPTATKRSREIDDQTSAEAADSTQPAKKQIINHIPAASTSPPTGGAGSSQDHASQAETLNRRLHEETQQLQARLNDTIQMAKLEAAEQRQVNRAEVASCELQLEELGNRSSHVLEEAQRSTRYSKLHSDLFETEAQERAQSRGG